MEEIILRKRAYFFVPYNISEIQKTIQAGHAFGRYILKYGKDNPDHIIWDFLTSHETWIVLNGGTTNEDRDFDGIVAGTLNQIADDLLKNNIEFSYFHEPDLNHALTAVCFITDERVFNRELYPDFVDFLNEKLNPENNAQESIALRVQNIDFLTNEKYPDILHKTNSKKQKQKE